jgi:hypothetical protein
MIAAVAAIAQGIVPATRTTAAGLAATSTTAAGLTAICSGHHASGGHGRHGGHGGHSCRGHGSGGHGCRRRRCMNMSAALAHVRRRNCRAGHKRTSRGYAEATHRRADDRDLQLNLVEVAYKLLLDVQHCFVKPCQRDRVLVLAFLILVLELHVLVLELLVHGSQVFLLDLQELDELLGLCIFCFQHVKSAHGKIC